VPPGSARAGATAWLAISAGGLSTKAHSLVSRSNSRLNAEMGWGASCMRFNQQDFRRRFGMNLFTLVAAFATIGWLWLLIEFADLLLHRHTVWSIWP
jgi:hypothetical protein